MRGLGLFEFFGVMFEDFGPDHVDNVFGDVGGVITDALQESGNQ
jgi:hypothetical protein